MIELELLSIKFSLRKVTLKIGQEKYVLLITFWKLILKKEVEIKDMNGENVTGSFYEKELLRNKIEMSCYPETESY